MKLKHIYLFIFALLALPLICKGRSETPDPRCTSSPDQEAIYKSKGDALSLIFIVLEYFAVLLLFWCLIFYVRTAPNADQRWKLNIVVWSLFAFLTAMFSYKDAELMPWPIDLVVWAMSATMRSGSWLTGFNTIQAIYESKGDALSLISIVSEYFAVLLLFWCLIFHMRTAPNYAAQRWKLNVAIWFFSIFLTAMYSYD